MTIEIHEVDITDVLNKMLYDELKEDNKKLYDKCELEHLIIKDLQKENDKLKKQLGIAINALKEYSESDNWFMEDSEGKCWSFNKQYPWRIVFKALKKIKELNK